jgi:hypothetical protein
MTASRPGAAGRTPAKARQGTTVHPIELADQRSHEAERAGLAGNEYSATIWNYAASEIRSRTVISASLLLARV